MKSLLTALMASAMLGVSNTAHPALSVLPRDDEDNEGAALNTKLEVAVPLRNGRNYYPAPTVGPNYSSEYIPSRAGNWDPGDDAAEGPTPSRVALDAAAAKRARKAARLINLPRPRGDVP